ncbi:MAG: hypothetical protein P8Y51_09180 [Campylobacterales bacterium]
MGIFARSERVPEQFEDRFGHIGVADDVVGLPDQFRFRIAGEFDKIAIGIYRFACSIRFGKDLFFRIDRNLDIERRKPKRIRHKNSSIFGARMLPKCYHQIIFIFKAELFF